MQEPLNEHLIILDSKVNPQVNAKAVLDMHNSCRKKQEAMLYKHVGEVLTNGMTSHAIDLHTPVLDNVWISGVNISVGYNKAQQVVTPPGVDQSPLAAYHVFLNPAARLIASQWDHSIRLGLSWDDGLKFGDRRKFVTAVIANLGNPAATHMGGTIFSDKKENKTYYMCWGRDGGIKVVNFPGICRPLYDICDGCRLRHSTITCSGAYDPQGKKTSCDTKWCTTLCSTVNQNRHSRFCYCFGDKVPEMAHHIRENNYKPSAEDLEDILIPEGALIACHEAVVQEAFTNDYKIVGLMNPGCQADWKKWEKELGRGIDVLDKFITVVTAYKRVEAKQEKEKKKEVKAKEEKEEEEEEVSSREDEKEHRFENKENFYSQEELSMQMKMMEIQKVLESEAKERKEKKEKEEEKEAMKIVHLAAKESKAYENEETLDDICITSLPRKKKADFSKIEAKGTRVPFGYLRSNFYDVEDYDAFYKWARVEAMEQSPYGIWRLNGIAIYSGDNYKYLGCLVRGRFFKEDSISEIVLDSVPEIGAFISPIYPPLTGAK